MAILLGCREISKFLIPIFVIYGPPYITILLRQNQLFDVQIFFSKFLADI